MFEMEFLGSGTSTGMPIPSCGCVNCRSKDPRDTRWRSSVVLRRGGRNLVIDTGPEFRLQCLRAGIESLDGVLYTHHHADHLNGLDDLRCFTLRLNDALFDRPPMQVWASAASLRSIRRHFDYIWTAVQKGGGLPKIVLNEATDSFVAAGFEVRPIPIKHGTMDILGYRIGGLSYMTDISALPETSYPLVEGTEVLVISFARRESHETHFNMADAVALHRRLRPRQTLITHIAHYFSHQDLLDELPEGMTPAYDGLKVEVGEE